jgi:hypothetical protein
VDSSDEEAEGVDLVDYSEQYLRDEDDECSTALEITEREAEVPEEFNKTIEEFLNEDDSKFRNLKNIYENMYVWSNNLFGSTALYSSESILPVRSHFTPPIKRNIRGE